LVLRPRMMTPVTLALAGGVTMLTASASFVPFAFRSPSSHVALESAVSVIALVTAVLAWGRFRYSNLLSDLAICLSLAIVALSQWEFSAVPSLSRFAGSHAFSTWMTVVGSVLSSVLLVVAACAPDRHLARPVRSAVSLACASLVLLVAIAIPLRLVATSLPIGIDPSLSPRDASFDSGQPAILATQFCLAVLLAVAAIGFNRRAATGGEFYSWLSAASIAAAFGRADYFLFPSLYSNWVYTGDFLRAASYLLLLVAVLREISAYQARIARDAVLEERRRIAREYHDGLAQELAYTVAQLQVASRLHPGFEHVSASAQRAMRECRLAIAALTAGPNEELATAVAETAEGIAAREGARLEIDLEPGITVPRQLRDALVRVTGEALTNAARHGHAQTIRVELLNGDGTFLRIRDDGIGFDPDQPAGSGFGLVSMRERMQALGGEMRVESTPGAGTLVEVRIP
jgi:signal transduction histidine kinase